MKTLIQMKIIYFNLLKRNTSLQNNFATPQSNKNMKLGLAVKIYCVKRTHAGLVMTLRQAENIIIAAFVDLDI